MSVPMSIREWKGCGQPAKSAVPGLKAEQAVLGGLAALAAAQLIGEGGLCHLSAQVS